MSKKIQVKVKGKWLNHIPTTFKDLEDVRLVDESGCEKNEEHRQTCTCFSCLPKHFEPEGEHESQVDRLAKFIMEEVEGEPSQSEGTIDTAIRIIRELMNGTKCKVAPGDHISECSGNCKPDKIEKSECKHESDMCVTTKDKGVFRSVCKKCEEWYYNNGHIKLKKIEKLGYGTSVEERECKINELIDDRTNSL